MKLIDLSCPKCGAKLQVNSELKMCACNYCGHQFAIEEERSAEEAGYNFERGRQRAAAELEEEKKKQEAEQKKEDKIKLIIATFEVFIIFFSLIGLLFSCATH